MAQPLNNHEKQFIQWLPWLGIAIGWIGELLAKLLYKT
jgi:hypothetical protein